MQARAWAADGIGTLVVDPIGTGDSAGEFGDGDWSAWRDDLERGLEWLGTHGNGCVALLGHPARRDHGRGTGGPDRQRRCDCCSGSPS